MQTTSPLRVKPLTYNQRPGTLSPAVPRSERYGNCVPRESRGTLRSIAVSTSVPETPFIACVDDDESVGEAIREMLKALDLDAEAYLSGESFLSSGKLDRTACLITDVSMHGMSGFDLMRRLAALGYSIPTIVVTGYANDRTRAEAISAGAVCFLSKPVAKQELLAWLELALNLSHGGTSPKNPN